MGGWTALIRKVEIPVMSADSLGVICSAPEHHPACGGSSCEPRNTDALYATREPDLPMGTLSAGSTDDVRPGGSRSGFIVRMKNIQVINGALNCTFSVFRATDEEFALLFPEPRQDIQYVEDLAHLADQPEINAALRRIWERPIRKSEAQGIHGTLFYQLERYKKWYREKREDAVEPSAINAAQRRLFGTG